MRKTLKVLILLATIPAGAAFAGDDCSVPLADWQPREAVVQLAQDNGWTVRRLRIDDGCYQIRGTDTDGRRFKVKLDPATLEVVKFKFEDDDDRRTRDGRRDRDDRDDCDCAPRDPASAGPPRAPDNPLFGSGAPPQVQVN